jgi:hypothetical protein
MAAVKLATDIVGYLERVVCGVSVTEWLSGSSGDLKDL